MKYIDIFCELKDGVAPLIQEFFDSNEPDFKSFLKLNEEGEAEDLGTKINYFPKHEDKSKKDIYYFRIDEDTGEVARVTVK